MAILKSVVNVNNGNTGWTRQNVLDALETTFANLGWNGGSAITGSPVAIVAPGATAISATAYNDNFQYCGGPAPSFYPSKIRYFYVTNNGTSSYNLLEEFVLNTYNATTDLLYINRHGLQTGDTLVYNPNNIPTSTVNFATFTTGQTYYVIRVDGGTIKLALTAEDAANSIGINFDAATGAWSTVPLFRRGFNVLYNNYTIDVEAGDTLNFTIVDTTSGGNFFLIDSPTTGYAANRVLNTTNRIGNSYTTFPTNAGSGALGVVIWEVKGWHQTETQNGNPQDTESNRKSEIQRYGYGNSTNPAMRGEIRILPSYTTNNYSAYNHYYKYTVPASGGRSELKLRVYRLAYQYGNRGSIAHIRITSIGFGWGENETFTIPGSAIGGVDSTNDILVGVNSATTAQQSARNGVCSLLVTNYGAGSNMYQKSGSGHFAVLKNINDAAKTYGTTYYGFGMDITNPYRMYISSGMSWQTLDRRGTNHSSINANREYGYYYGQPGLDYAESYNYINVDNITYFAYIDFATTSTPTAYPLSIRTYKAQSPQDTNFAVIQFTQTINNVIVPFATFSLHKGPLVGANVWDLNNVWNGAYTNYTTTARGITMLSRISSYKYYYYSNNDDSVEEIPTSNTMAREANYGYFRNSTSDSAWLSSTYECNIDTYNSATNIVTYYRNATYDKYTTSYDYLVNSADRTNSVSASANYYKPMKGLPICNNMMPCPYYLPDDYVMLQVATSPGLTQFRPGDTVAVSAGEVYEIILAGYETQRNGLDNVESNQSMGMLFCARTT
jgi:hypothetical protein